MGTEPLDTGVQVKLRTALLPRLFYQPVQESTPVPGPMVERLAPIAKQYGVPVYVRQLQVKRHHRRPIRSDISCAQAAATFSSSPNSNAEVSITAFAVTR